MITTTENDPLTSVVAETLSGGSTAALEQYLGRHPAADPFVPILNRGVAQQLFPAFGNLTFDRWLLEIDAWLDHVQDPRTDVSTAEKILHHVWDHFSTNLIESLRLARIAAGIPAKGGVLAYVGHLAKCIVIEYRFAGSLPRLRPVALISDPQSAFDVYIAIDQADQAARNTLKSILASGHKLVSHRGVLVHVDRRIDDSVFGPSIDTLVMAEILDSRFFRKMENGQATNGDAPHVVMEIGSGSGMLCAAMTRYLSSMQELFCIDVDFGACSCTEKNVEVARRMKGAVRKAQTYIICGPFAPSLIQRKIDLLVCNPPYIPVPQNIMTSGSTPDYFKAVANLDLMKQVITATPTLLSTAGRLLIMVSSVCLQDALNAVPESCDVHRPLGDAGFEALFDVEAVLHNGPWLDQLLSLRGLVKKGDAYYHTLHPLWITPKKEAK